MRLDRAPTLETPRLRLRSFRVEDFDAYAALWADPHVTRHILPAPLDREAAWDALLRRFGFWPALGFGFFAVEDRETGEFLGEVGFQERLRAIEPSMEGALETGWLMAPAAQGRGLAAEAVAAALAWASAAFPEKRVVCIVAPDNAPSLRLAIRCGFVEIARSLYKGKQVVQLERHEKIGEENVKNHG
jgi:RimJ/RimL family protein N-acetyltransferase